MRQPESSMQPARTEEPTAAHPPAGYHDQLWESVLRETVSMCSADEPLTEEEREAFRKVAQTHPGHPFCLEPVLVSLVTAVLETQFSERIRAVAEWPELIRVVAGSLYEDPVMNQRLSAFWAQLVKDQVS